MSTQYVGSNFKLRNLQVANTKMSPLIYHKIYVWVKKIESIQVRCSKLWGWIQNFVPNFIQNNSEKDEYQY